MKESERLQNFINLIEDHMEEIRTMGLEQYKESFEYPSLSGWYVGVEISEDGTVYAVGPMDRNSQTMASYQGWSVSIVSFETKCYEFNGDLSDYEVKDIEAFRQYIIEREELSEDDEDFEDQIEDYITMDEYTQFNSEQYEKWRGEAFEADIDCYGEQQVDEAIERTLGQMRDTLSDLTEYQE